MAGEFESKDGLLHAYSFQDHYDPKYITEGLGEDWTFTKSSIKVYPCCRYFMVMVTALE